MPDVKPVVYILRGDDRVEIESQINKFYQKLGNPDMAEMNTTRLAGKVTNLNDLRTAALAMPFLTDRRLVILEDALQPFAGRGKQNERQDFLELLASLPQTTALVLVIPDSKHYKKGWESTPEKHWLIQWARQPESRALVMDCRLPTEYEMGNWVRQKAAECGGSFTPMAVKTLIEYVGNNTQRAAQEITKLLTYVNFERPVDDDDVRRLTHQEHQSDIFTLVDAIGSRNGQQALNMLHLLLEEMDLIPLFGMVVRQFRLILQAREILDAGGNPQEVARLLGQHPFVAQKVSVQAGQFDMGQLEKIYHRLLEIDLDMKTGGMPGDIALDVLIAELAL